MAKRIFIAINLPSELKEKFGKIIEELKKINQNYKIKWVNPENLHLTLHFFGELNEKQITLAEEGMEEITKNIGSFEITTDEFGCFPDERAPRVIFSSVKSSDEIHNLIGKLELTLENLGYKVDSRKWQGHLTLGRIKEWSECKISKIEIPPMTFPVKSIELMESELAPEGSIYSVIKSFPLK